MSLTNKQVAFLSTEFGIDNFTPDSLSPLEMWKLREQFIDYECDDDANNEQIDIAASLVDYMSSVIPDDWRLKTPPEVAALYSEEMASVDTYYDRRVATAV